MHVNFLPDRIQNIWVAFFHLVFLGGCLQVILRQTSEALLLSFLNLYSLKVLNIDQLTTWQVKLCLHDNAKMKLKSSETWCVTDAQMILKWHSNKSQKTLKTNNTQTMITQCSKNAPTTLKQCSNDSQTSHKQRSNDAQKMLKECSNDTQKKLQQSSNNT